ncbi:MAG: glycosyltransferase [Rhodothermaceae bacterium]|nr:glycosyltransferase [Rhodothermaceae bacterium]
MHLSIVIPAFNEAKYIEHTIKRIQHALIDIKEPRLTWEIIVCDNNSTDQTAEIATRAGAIVIHEPVQQIARARNKGAGVAKGEWLLFIDADTYPSQGLMKEVQGIIESNGYIGCGTTIQVEDGTLFNKLRMERLNPLFRLLKLCGGAFLLCRKEAFVSISGFSTRLYAYEEIDFVLRLKKEGRKQNRTFKIIHQHPAITSGRKGGYDLGSIMKLFSSNFAAVLLFGLNYVLPKSWMEWLGTRLLGFWYNERL